MILQVDSAIKSSSFFSNLSPLEWLGIISSFAGIIGIPLTIIFYIVPSRNARQEKKKNREKYYKRGGWIKAGKLEYGDLDSFRERQNELNPSNHEELTVKINAYLKSNPKNILLKGPSLSGKSHLTIRILTQLADAYVLLPKYELLKQTTDLEALFPKTLQKAKYKIVLMDDLQEFLSKGETIPNEFIDFLKKNGCILWFNYVSHWESDSEISDFGFKQLNAFEVFEISRLNNDEINSIINEGNEKPQNITDGTIGALFYPLNYMVNKYLKLPSLCSEILVIIKQAYMLGYNKQGFEIPYDVLYNYFHAEYDAPDNTKAKLDEVLEILSKSNFINKIITHKSFVFEPVYLDKVVAPSLNYNDFVDSWEVKGLMKAENWFSVGYYFGESNMFQEAIHHYQKAVDIKPDFFEACYNMGLNNYKLGKYETAIEKYQKVVDIKPDDYKAWFNMGFAYDDLGKYETAIEKYQKAVDIKPDYYQAWYNMGLVYDNLEKYETAIEKYQKAVDIKPDHYKAWNYMGLAYYDLGEHETAIEKYQKAVDIKPDFHKAWHNMGNVYNDLGEYETAIEKYQKAVDIKPDYDIAWKNMALAYIDLGDETKAQKCFDKYNEILNNQK